MREVRALHADASGNVRHGVPRKSGWVRAERELHRTFEQDGKEDTSLSTTEKCVKCAGSRRKAMVPDKDNSCAWG